VDELLALIQEAVDRSRRIETRLTKYLVGIGVETGVRRPVWHEGTVEAPSPATSLMDCLSVIPATWDPNEEVLVIYRGRPLGCVLKP